jgi:chemotaxis protein histidine kinase CheA
VRHAVAALGGTVRMESEVGRGTRVTVVIPQAGA